MALFCLLDSGNVSVFEVMVTQPKLGCRLYISHEGDIAKVEDVIL
jgi:hypothetical protein